MQVKIIIHLSSNVKSLNFIINIKPNTRNCRFLFLSTCSTLVFFYYLFLKDKEFNIPSSALKAKQALKTYTKKMNKYSLIRNSRGGGLVENIK